MSSQSTLTARTRVPLGSRLSVLAVVVCCGLVWCFEPVRDRIFPLRIASGSMAPALVGPAEHVVCADCQFSYAAGNETLPDTGPLLCPNCGHPQRGRWEPGEKVRRVARFEPARWEVVAVAIEGPAPHWEVKRIVGLPQEQISLADGDVFVDGRRLQKDLASMRQVAILVHDDRYRPSLPGSLTHRWQPARPESGWSATPDGYRWSPAANDRVRIPQSLDDWLVYQHVGHRPPAYGRDTRLPIDDEYAYNQNLSRRLHIVADRFVTMDLGVLFSAAQVATDRPVGLPSGAMDQFVCEWYIGPRSVRLIGDLATHELRLTHGGTTARVPFDPYPGQPTPVGTLLWGNWDGQIVIAWNEQVLLQQACDLEGWEEVGDDDQAASAATRPFRCATNIAGLDLSAIRIYRDIYYTHPHDLDQPWRTNQRLRADEYLLLGDNSPLSLDARHDPERGIVNRSQLMGRIVPWSSPPGGSIMRGPQAGKVRYNDRRGR